MTMSLADIRHHTRPGAKGGAMKTRAVLQRRDGFGARVAGVLLAVVACTALVWHLDPIRALRVWAQASGSAKDRAVRRPPPLLSADELDIGLKVRVEKMRERQAARAARKVQEQDDLSAEQRAAQIDLPALPREPVPAEPPRPAQDAAPVDPAP